MCQDVGSYAGRSVCVACEPPLCLRLGRVVVCLWIVNSNLLGTTPGQAAVPLRHDTNDRDESQGQCVKDEPGRVGACCEAQAQVVVRGGPLSTSLHHPPERGWWTKRVVDGCNLHVDLLTFCVDTVQYICFCETCFLVCLVVRLGRDLNDILSTTAPRSSAQQMHVLKQKPWCLVGRIPLQFAIPSRLAAYGPCSGCSDVRASGVVLT